MKLVGAKNSFIRRPFIISNIISGIIAAFIAMGLLGALLFYLLQDYGNFTTWISGSILWIVLASVLVLGILISIFATYFAINKYLRMKNDDLYYI
jgi:cell division transport system permease protein